MIWYGRRVWLLAGLAAALLVVGCTPTTHHLQPYRDDPAQAGEVERRANEFCSAHRGRCDLPPHPFTTDGCSLWPDSTWVDCCVEHDIAYWCGGSCQDRQRADQRLSECVAAHGAAGTGSLMYGGVRVGGPPWYPFPFRWGYGWDWPRGYETLSTPTGACPPQAASSDGPEPRR